MAARLTALIEFDAEGAYDSAAGTIMTSFTTILPLVSW